jgi:hypothetical protein
LAEILKELAMAGARARFNNHFEPMKTNSHPKKERLYQQVVKLLT